MKTREKLEKIATNMWWSWNSDAIDLFRRIDPDTFGETCNNPIATLKAAGPGLFDDDIFIQDVDAIFESFQAYMTSQPRFASVPKISYFCMEYGLHESMPIYSGGLGILAGDHAKAASDMGLPFTAVGLFLREGYFKQHLREDGQQRESYPSIQPEDHPLSLVTDEDGKTVIVTVLLGTTPLYIQAWRLHLGRIILYLLDTDFEANQHELREITRRLYQGGRKNRIQQEIVLGIGGFRMLRALGIKTDVYHMNEGHCAFLTLELLREHLAAGMSRSDAELDVREHCVFTTHTPVIAGHDRFERALFLELMDGFRTELNLSEHDLLAYGRVNPNNPHEAFTMTVLGLKLSRKANGVSKLNGEVARKQWRLFYPTLKLDEIPIGYITNGVHLPTWISPVARRFFSEHLNGQSKEYSDPTFWFRITNLPDETLWRYRSLLRCALVEAVNERLSHQHVPHTFKLNPEALTIGFARRFAMYKRATLLFSDLEKAIEIFSRKDQPVQIIFAGKAHPADAGGKQLIRQIHQASRHPSLKGKVAFLENYTMATGRLLVSGCDVWLNNPRRPMEASGTSGQKVAMHGGLNLSILDGWWPEGYTGSNGWAIGNNASSEIQDEKRQDREDAQHLYYVLNTEVIPTFYDRNKNGLPNRWISLMRNAMKTLPILFGAERMLADYLEQMYRVDEAVKV